MAFSDVRDSSLITVYDQLRSAIIAGELAGGSWLRQTEIGARYGVSKIPVREALRQLEAQGFVTLHPGRGAVVVPLSAEEAEEIYLMRIALEPLLLTRSAPHLTQMEFARARATLSLIDTIENLSIADWHTLDCEFHAILYQAAPLPRVQREVDTLRDSFARYFSIFQSLGDQFWAERTKEHYAMLNACQAGDIALATDLLTQHMVGSSAELLAALHEQIAPIT